MASLFSWIVSLFLAAIFLFSAIAKNRSILRTGQSFETLGVPAKLSVGVVKLVIATELFVSCLLLIPSMRFAGAIAVIAILTIFSCVLVANLMVGNRASCACFGIRSQRPINGSTLMRNGVLQLLALVVLLL